MSCRALNPNNNSKNGDNNNHINIKIVIMIIIIMIIIRGWGSMLKGFGPSGRSLIRPLGCWGLGV